MDESILQNYLRRIWRDFSRAVESAEERRTMKKHRATLRNRSDHSSEDNNRGGVALLLAGNAFAQRRKLAVGERGQRFTDGVHWPHRKRLAWSPSL